MGPVQPKVLAYIKRRLDEGELPVSEAEIMDAVIPPDRPKIRERPACRYGLDRLRHVIDAIPVRTGRRHSFIAAYPSAASWKSL